MKVRLSKDNPYNKITVSANGMVIEVTKEWTYIPSEQFLRNGMEIEGQQKPVLEQKIEVQKEVIVEQPKERSKPVISIKPKKK